MRLRPSLSGCLALLLILVTAAPAAADPVTVTPDERIIGAADARVTVIEYASLTCPACARFHRDVLPEVKERFVDTGKVRLVLRDFPLDRIALASALLVRCMGEPDRQAEAFGLLLERQEDWARSDRPLAAARGVLKPLGLEAEAAEQCLQDEKLVEAVATQAQAGHDHLGVAGTPAFSVAGEPAAFIGSIEEFEAAIRPFLD